jgi:hypothetical protein
MPPSTQYGPIERLCLWSAAVVGLAGVNGAFLYGLVHAEVLRAAMANPVSLAFMVEAFVLLALLAYLLPKWGVARLHWAWFVTLALLGSLAFAFPVTLLWPRRSGSPRQ